MNFDRFNKDTKTEDLFSDAFNIHPELKDSYDEILVIHNNNLSTFVPEPLFDENFLGSYLQYNNKVFESDFFAFDKNHNYQMNTVYIPYANINTLFNARVAPAAASVWTLSNVCHNDVLEKGAFFCWKLNQPQYLNE